MAQFVPYLIIGAIGIIGEWLLGPKAARQNPNQMPQLNQSLRGSPLYVTFGTNRVNAQVVWTKNWKAVKQGGGKKGGGSGGLGSAKGSTGTGYTYTWDAMFNYGIVDAVSFIGRAWIGNDPVRHTDIQALNSGIDGANLTLINSAYTSTSSTMADLKYTEAHVSPGFGTGDAETWSYFQTQENLSCAWPSTFWIGFRALNLGSSAQLPQLSVELSPVENTVAGASFVMTPTNASSWQSEPFMADDSGALYATNYDPGGNNTDRHRFSYYAFADATERFILESVWEADVLALGLSTSSLTWGGNVPIPGSPYVYVLGRVSGLSNPAARIVGVLYKINTDKSITRQGGFEWGWNPADGGTLGHAPPNIPTSVRRMDDGTVKMVFPARGSNGALDGTLMNITTLLDPTSLLGSTTSVDLTGTVAGTFAWDRNTREVTGVGSNFLFPGTDRPGGAPNLAACTEFGVLSYIGKAEMSWAAAHSSGLGFCQFIKDLSGANPNGTMVMVDYNGGVTAPFASATPFDDVQLTSSGGAGTADDDYGAPVQYGQRVYLGRGCSDDTLKGRIRVYDFDGTALTLASTLTTDFATTTQVPQPSLKIQHLRPYENDSDGNIYIEANYASGSQSDVVSLFGLLSLPTDVTPPYIIKRVLTSKVFGFQTDALFGFTVTDASIDTTSYNDAVSHCEDNGIQIAVTYTNQQSVLDIFNELLALYNGYLVEHGGTIYFGVLRDTDTAFRTIDNSHLISPGPGQPPVDVTKGAVQDGFNIIEFQYLDRNLEYNQNTVTVEDPVDIDFNGPRKKTYSAKFTMAGSTAQQCAERALWSNLYGKDNYAFKLGVKDADLRPGRIITLVDSFDQTLRGGVEAIITDWEETKRLEFSVRATRIFTDHLTATHPYTRTSSPGNGPVIDPVQPPFAMRAYELPKRFQGTTPAVYFGYNQASAVMGQQLWLSLDGTTFTQDLDDEPYPTTGIMGRALPARDAGYIETNVDVYLMPSSSGPPTYVQTTDIDDTSISARRAGLTGIIVGSEFIACEDATLIAQNHYRIAKMYRGWGGTPINAVTSGAYWNHHGDGVMAHQIGPADIGKIFYYKILPYDFGFGLCDISSVNAQTYQVRGDYWLPSIPGPISIFVQSAVSWPASTAWNGDMLGVNDAGLVLSWPPSANDEGFGFGGAGNGGAGHFTSDVVTPSYRLNINNGITSLNYVTNTGYFAYSSSQNSTDFGGAQGRLSFTVTPYNSYGDAPSSSVRSLFMFGSGIIDQSRFLATDLAVLIQTTSGDFIQVV